MPRKLVKKLIKPVVYFITVLFLMSTVAPTVYSLFSSEQKSVSSSYMK